MLAGLRPSIGIVGDALDNALCETTTGPHRTECSHGSPFRSGPIRTLADLEDIASAGWSTPVTHNKVCEYPGGFNLRSGRKRFTTRSA